MPLRRKIGRSVTGGSRSTGGGGGGGVSRSADDELHGGRRGGNGGRNNNGNGGGGECRRGAGTLAVAPSVCVRIRPPLPSEEQEEERRRRRAVAVGGAEEEEELVSGCRSFDRFRDALAGECGNVGVGGRSASARDASPAGGGGGGNGSSGGCCGVSSGGVGGNNDGRSVSTKTTVASSSATTPADKSAAATATACCPPKSPPRHKRFSPGRLLIPRTPSRLSSPRRSKKAGPPRKLAEEAPQDENDPGGANNNERSFNGSDIGGMSVSSVASSAMTNATDTIVLGSLTPSKFVDRPSPQPQHSPTRRLASKLGACLPLTPPRKEKEKVVAVAEGHHHRTTPPRPPKQLMRKQSLSSMLSDDADCSSKKSKGSSSSSSSVLLRKVASRSLHLRIGTTGSGGNGGSSSSQQHERRFTEQEDRDEREHGRASSFGCSSSSTLPAWRLGSSDDDDGSNRNMVLCPVPVPYSSCPSGFRSSVQRAYEFDGTYGPESWTERLYSEQVRPAVLSALDGYDSAVIALGPRGGGKTYCLTGTEGDPGIVPLAVLDLFARKAANDAGGEEASRQDDETRDDREQRQWQGPTSRQTLSSARSKYDKVDSRVPPWRKARGGKNHQRVASAKERATKREEPEPLLNLSSGRKRYRVKMTCVRLEGDGDDDQDVWDCLSPRATKSSRATANQTPRVANLSSSFPAASPAAAAAAAQSSQVTVVECSTCDEAFAALKRATLDCDRVSSRKDKNKNAARATALVVRFSIECSAELNDGTSSCVRTSSLTFVDPSSSGSALGSDDIDSTGGSSDIRAVLEAAAVASAGSGPAAGSNDDSQSSPSSSESSSLPPKLSEYRLPHLLRPASLLRSNVAIVCAIPPPPPPSVPSTAAAAQRVIPIPSSNDSFMTARAEEHEEHKQHPQPVSECEDSKIAEEEAAAGAGLDALSLASRLRRTLRLRPRRNPAILESAEAARYKNEIRELQRKLAEREEAERIEKRRAETELERSRREVERLKGELLAGNNGNDDGGGGRGKKKGGAKAEASAHRRRHPIEKGFPPQSIAGPKGGRHDPPAGATATARPTTRLPSSLPSDPDDDDTEDARERRLRDVARHVDNAMLRIAKANGLDLTPLMSSISMAATSPTSGVGGVGGEGVTSPPLSGAIAEEPDLDDDKGDGSIQGRQRLLGGEDKKKLDPSSSPKEEENDDDDDDDDELTGWNGVGVIGALLEDDAFSRQSRLSSSRGSSSSRAHPPLVLTTDNYNEGDCEISPTSECSGLSSPIVTLQKVDSGGSVRSRTSRRSRRSRNNGAASVFATMPGRLLPPPPPRSDDDDDDNQDDNGGIIVSQLGEDEDGIDAVAPGGVFNFDEWDKRSAAGASAAQATHDGTFATCQQGSSFVWREEHASRTAADANANGKVDDEDEDFRSVRSSSKGGQRLKKKGHHDSGSDDEGRPPPHHRGLFSSLTPLGLASPREQVFSSSPAAEAEAVVAADPGGEEGGSILPPRMGTTEPHPPFGEEGRRTDDNDDDAISVVSDAVSSLTSATTLFGRCDHGRDPAVVVGELWRIQGLLRSAMKEAHGGHGGRHDRHLEGGGITMDELRRNDFRMPASPARERWG